MPEESGTVATRIGPLIDSNVHLWDQARNPVFWLTDRTLVRDMIGNYDSLPDTFALGDYLQATSPLDVRGIVWSDPGAADPVAAAEWVAAQNADGRVIGLVALADPADPSFERLVSDLRRNPLVSSVRLRLVPALAGSSGLGAAETDARFLDALRQLADQGLVATIEAGAGQLDRVTAYAGQFADLPIVLDHFGWPDDLSDAGRRTHLVALRRVADQPNVSTRIDAIGTIFGAWDRDTIRPWLTDAVEVFGPERCMLGSDFPIESLRSTFGGLYGAYDAIFDSCSDADRRLLFGEVARRLYGADQNPRK